jgi:hypothetical protein
MSELAQQLFESLKVFKEAVVQLAPGLKDLGPEVAAEIGRLNTQATMELASGLFNGNAFVPYGPGQYTPLRSYQTPRKESLQSRRIAFRYMGGKCSGMRGMRWTDLWNSRKRSTA